MLDARVVLTQDFISKKGQLAREPDESKTDPFWFAKMTPIPIMGSKYGRRVTWISAAGEATFMKLEVSLISPQSLRKSTVTANLSAISKQRHIFCYTNITVQVYFLCG
jgi:hypothetical protein